MPSADTNANTGKRLARDPERAAHCASILKAVVHPLRLRIVAILCQGERNVSELAEELEAPQPVVSQQLRILRMSGLVASRRAGGFAVYRLTEQNLRSLVSCMERCSRPGGGGR